MCWTSQSVDEFVRKLNIWECLEDQTIFAVRGEKYKIKLHLNNLYWDYENWHISSVRIHMLDVIWDNGRCLYLGVAYWVHISRILIKVFTQEEDKVMQPMNSLGLPCIAFQCLLLCLRGQQLFLCDLSWQHISALSFRPRITRERSDHIIWDEII